VLIDRTKAIPIWGELIPYNKKKSKLADMKIQEICSLDQQLMRFCQMIKGESLSCRPEVVDTFTYLCEIKDGNEKETYEDVPYIIPFLVPGSKAAVLVVPGGGFAYKSTDYRSTAASEGSGIAKSLNDAGISAFVLWYRSHPYRFPVPILDLQRAVRYVRFHAHSFGILPSKLGVVGFSAGGFSVGALVNLLRNAPVIAEGYTEDVIDRMDDSVVAAAYVYPVITLQYNVSMLYAMYEASRVQNVRFRKEILQELDLKQYIQAGDPSQYICYGTEDSLVNPAGIRLYKEELDRKGIKNKCFELIGADHGFGDCENQPVEFANWKNDFTGWMKQQFESR